MFNTEIKTNVGLCMIVPNSMIWSSPITNYSRNPTRRFDLPVGIGYDDDIDTHMAGNICRCGTYTRIKQAIRAAAEKVRNL